MAERFPTQESCIAHLEQIRFGDEPFCPLCGTVGECARKKQGNVIGRWNCHTCKSSFNVLSKTMFQGTHLPLQKWFCAIALIVNAKKSLSSCQLARDLNLNQKTAWYMQQRIRAEMATKQGRIMLSGLIEADETYVGGRPRKRNKRDDDKLNPQGTRNAQDRCYRRCGAFREGCGRGRRRILSGKGVLAFIKRAIDPDASTLVTDEYGAYNVVRRIMDHCVIRHSESYVDGESHQHDRRRLVPAQACLVRITSPLHETLHAALRGRSVLQVQSPEGR